MSVHKRNGRWQVKYREPSGKQRSGGTFDRKGDADRVDLEIRRRLQLGRLADDLTRTAPTLEQFALGGFQTHAALLAPDTVRQYRWALNNHLTALLDTPLDQITVGKLRRLQHDLLEAGRSPNTVKIAMMMLSGVLQVAVEHDVIPANPVRSLRKVSVPRADEKTPLAPVELEALINVLEGRERIIAVLGGHLGLSPIEIRLAPWGNLAPDYSTLLIGAGKTKKQRAHARVIDVPQATALELRRWRLESGRPADSEPIIGPMTPRNLRAVGLHKLKPAARQLTGRDDVTVYTLRHSHASALHYCGFNVAEAAERLGHSQIVHLRHYSHVIKTLRGRPHHPDLDALIAAARAEVRAPSLREVGP